MIDSTREDFRFERFGWDAWKCASGRFVFLRFRLVWQNDNNRARGKFQNPTFSNYSRFWFFLALEALREHHERALNPMHPHLRGSNQNPDVYFQTLEASNK